MEWGFPSIGSFVNNNGFVIAWCIGVLPMSAFLIASWFSRSKKSENDGAGERSSQLMSLIGGFVFFLVAGGGLVKLGHSYNEFSACRQFDLNSISHIAVARMRNEFAEPQKSIRFEKSERLTEGLSLLRRAGDRGRRKSTFFEDGYRFELFTSDSDAPQVRLYYFAKTNGGDETDAVVVECRPTGRDYKISDEVYSAPTFGDWVKREIVPEFAKN